MLKTFSSDHRNHIRKSIRKGFEIRFGHLELLDDIYEALAQSMHELGSPYHSKTYLRKMAEHLGGMLEFAVLYTAEGKIAGGGVFIYQGGTVFNLLQIFYGIPAQHTRANFYITVIERVIQRIKNFDPAQSDRLRQRGLQMKWSPRKQNFSNGIAGARSELPSLNQNQNSNLPLQFGNDCLPSSSARGPPDAPPV